MAQLTEILEIERKRDVQTQAGIIYLYQEGTFLRAYEWSAWLCVRYIREFKATHRKIKDSEQTMVFIGFPVTSLSKFVPEGCEIHDSDKRFEIILSSEMLPADRSTMSTDFQVWKNSLPLDKTKKEERRDQEESFDERNPKGLTSIMLKILQFPIEKKSPIDCMLFLADVKKQITEIL